MGSVEDAQTASRTAERVLIVVIRGGFERLRKGIATDEVQALRKSLVEIHLKRIERRVAERVIQSVEVEILRERQGELLNGGIRSVQRAAGKETEERVRPGSKQTVLQRKCRGWQHVDLLSYLKSF